MRIKAVIYDVDGTLINSEPLHVAAWDETLKKHGTSLKELPKEFVRMMAGKKPLVIATEMIDILNLKVDPNDFLRLKTQTYLNQIRKSLQEMPGATASVKRLKEAGYRLAIGTSLDRDLLDQLLTTLNIKNDFEVIVTGDQIKKGKPDPETYQKVIGLLKLEPHECLVIEDAQTGIRSAKAANAWCVAVENAGAVKQDTSEADATIVSLDIVTSTFIESIVAV